jgi:hypothetical protein
MDEELDAAEVARREQRLINWADFSLYSGEWEYSDEDDVDSE